MGHFRTTKEAVSQENVKLKHVLLRSFTQLCNILTFCSLTTTQKQLRRVILLV